MRVGMKCSELFDYKLNDISVKNVINHKQIGVFYDNKMNCIAEYFHSALGIQLDINHVLLMRFP